MATDTWSSDYLSAGSHLFSTYLANTVSDYEKLADRVTYALGYPVINLELHGNQIFTNIALAVEMFSKYAGYTEEHLVFDSDKYTRGKGLDISELMTLTPELTATYDSTIEVTRSTNTNVATTTAKDFTAGSNGTFISLFEFNVGDINVDPSEYTVTVVLDDTNVMVSKALVVATSGNGTTESADVQETEFGQVFTTSSEIFEISTVPANTTDTPYTNLVKVGIRLADNTTKAGSINANRNAVSTDTTTTSLITSQKPRIGYFDDLTRQKRKVIDVYSHEESSSTSLNTLFTIEQTLAQQSYFSYALGNYGFDLISWYILKQWLETREKMLSTKRYFKFNERTQHMLLIPEPKAGERFYGVVSCYVEKTIRDMIKEPWVYQYALALSKISIGRVRSKFGGGQFSLGGGSLDTGILQEGLTEKEKLEAMLTTGATPGFGDAAPPMFFVG